MTISDVSAAHKDSISPFLKSFQNLMRSNGRRAESSDGSHIWRILQPAYSGQVSPCIGAPVAQKTDYGWFEVFVGHPHSSSLSTEAYLRHQGKAQGPY